MGVIIGESKRSILLHLITLTLTKNYLLKHGQKLTMGLSPKQPTTTT